MGRVAAGIAPIRPVALGGPGTSPGIDDAATAAGAGQAPPQLGSCLGVCERWPTADAAGGCGSTVAVDFRRALSRSGRPSACQSAAGAAGRVDVHESRRRARHRGGPGPLVPVLAAEVAGGLPVVDADFLCPRLAIQFGLDATPSRADVVDGKAAWSEAVRPTGVPRLQILPGGMAHETGVTRRPGRYLPTCLRRI